MSASRTVNSSGLASSTSTIEPADLRLLILLLLAFCAIAKRGDVRSNKTIRCDRFLIGTSLWLMCLGRKAESKLSPPRDKTAVLVQDARLLGRAGRAPSRRMLVAVMTRRVPSWLPRRILVGRRRKREAA